MITLQAVGSKLTVYLINKNIKSKEYKQDVKLQMIRMMRLTSLNCNWNILNSRTNYSNIIVIESRSKM